MGSCLKMMMEQAASHEAELASCLAQTVGANRNAHSLLSLLKNQSTALSDPTQPSQRRLSLQHRKPLKADRQTMIGT